MIRPGLSETVQHAAGLLRERILAAAEYPVALGSEDDVARTLKLSKPTLRQVARLLEAEQILTVRRGVNGGFYGLRPTADGVAQTASVYLRAADTTYLQLFRGMVPVLSELSRLAAERDDEDVRAGVLAYVDAHASTPTDRESLRRFGQSRLELGRVIADVAGNPPLRLFLDVLTQLGNVPAGLSIYVGPDDIARTIRYERTLARAIRDGKPEVAARTVYRQAAHTMRWFEQNDASGQVIEPPRPPSRR